MILNAYGRDDDEVDVKALLVDAGTPLYTVQLCDFWFSLGFALFLLTVFRIKSDFKFLELILVSYPVHYAVLFSTGNVKCTYRSVVRWAHQS